MSDGDLTDGDRDCCNSSSSSSSSSYSSGSSTSGSPLSGSSSSRSSSSPDWDVLAASGRTSTSTCSWSSPSSGSRALTRRALAEEALAMRALDLVVRELCMGEESPDGDDSTDESVGCRCCYVYMPPSHTASHIPPRGLTPCANVQNREEALRTLHYRPRPVPASSVARCSAETGWWKTSASARILVAILVSPCQPASSVCTGQERNLEHGDA
ncbi:unnamed protein product [Mycena citricolor]|uniref:Uncharacterized protein n=1 Tax=Mycena citricolor TaxID=2018698 RepID=A0AAD2K868_9AGAR|nr:unnamed protein product [Mycena citricolor]